MKIEKIQSIFLKYLFITLFRRARTYSQCIDIKSAFLSKHTKYYGVIQCIMRIKYTKKYHLSEVIIHSVQHQFIYSVYNAGKVE